MRLYFVQTPVKSYEKKYNLLLLFIIGSLIIR